MLRLLLTFSIGVQSLQGIFKVTKQLWEWTCRGFLTGDQDKIVPKFAVGGKNFGGGGTQTAAGPVAGDSRTDLAACGIADTRLNAAFLLMFRFSQIAGRAPQDLQDQPRCHPFAARVRNPEKFRPPLEAPDRHLHGLSSRQALAAPGAASRQHSAAADGGHAGAESVPPLADKDAGLKSAFHGLTLAQGDAT